VNTNENLQTVSKVINKCITYTVVQSPFYSSYKGYKKSYPQQTKVNAIYNQFIWLHIVTPLNHENVIV